MAKAGTAKRSTIRKDSFCWKCTEKKTDVYCQNCVRSFHRSCYDISEDSVSIYTCEMCVSYSKSTDKDEHIALIPNIMEFLLTDPLLKPLKNLKFLRTNGKIVNAIDFIEMNEKAQRSSYKNFAEFRDDISWVVHNCQVLHSQQKKITAASKILLKQVDEEIVSIKRCHECYLNASKHPNDSFMMVCSVKHPVIQAKTDGFDYYPSKAMAFENNCVDVVYFGDHESDKVPLERCYKFSQHPPESSNSENDPIFVQAMNEAMEYIRNLGEDGLGNHSSADQTPFDPSTITNVELQPSLNHTNDLKVESSLNNTLSQTDSKVTVTTNRAEDDVLDDETALSVEVNTHSKVVQPEQPVTTNTTNGHSSLEKANAHNEIPPKKSDELLKVSTKDSIQISGPSPLTTKEYPLRPPKLNLNPFAVQNFEQPPQKKSRFDEYEPTEEWYDSMAESIGDLTNSAMIRIKQSNGATLLHMKKLQGESKQLKAQIQGLKNGWAKDKRENEAEITRLKEENDQLRKNTKNCTVCGKKVNTLLFCSENCQESAEKAIQKHRNQTPESE